MKIKVAIIIFFASNSIPDSFMSGDNPIIPAEPIGIDTLSSLKLMDRIKQRIIYKVLFDLLSPMSEIKIHKILDIRVKKPVVVLGFPGTVLVRSIAATQLVETLKLKFCGYLSSPDFAPLAAIHDYTPLPAARIHFSAEHNLVVVLSEMSIPVASSQMVADLIYKFARSMHAAYIVSLGGISLKEQKDTVYVISSDKNRAKWLVQKKLAKPIKEGATTGVTGVLLTQGMLDQFPVITLLAESSEEYLDPNAASKTLSVLSKMLNVDIDTGQLDKEAKEIASSIKESMIKSRVPKKSGPSSPDSMYG